MHPRGILRVIVIIFLTLILYSEAQAVYGIPRLSSKDYQLRGKIELTYDKRWSSDDDSTTDLERFIHSYTLGLNGFVIDKRLISFDIEGFFSQELNKPGDDITARGVSIRVNLLNEKILRGFFKRFPQPIELRFSNYKSSGTSLLNYGISLTYRPIEKPLYHSRIIQQQEIKKQQIKQKNRQQERKNEEEEEEGQNQQGQQAQQIQVTQKQKLEVIPPALLIPFPTFYLDYDKYKFKTYGQSLDTDRLDLRAESLSPQVDLKAEYSYYRLGGTSQGRYQDLDLQANFRSYDDKLAKRLDIYNRVFFRDYNDLKSFMVSNTTTWSRWLGKDRRDVLSLTGGGYYYNSEGTQNYNIGGTGTYNKYFSEAFRDSVTTTLNYGKNDEDTIYSILASNVIYYSPSRRVLITNNLGGGYTDLGTNFRGGLGITVRTIMDLTASYDFSSSATDEGRSDTHYFNFGFSGRVMRDLTFTSRNYYALTTVRGAEPYKQKTLELRGDIYWRVWRFNINLGASHFRLRKDDSDEVDTGLTSVYSNISTYLARRTYLSLSTTYSKDRRGESILSVHPILSWSFRMVALTAEYEMIKRKMREEKTTDHRLFFRLTRTFVSTFRGIR